MISKRLSPEQFFMATMVVVNGGNYFYNLILGRVLSPAAFSDAAILITFLLVLSFLGMTFQIVTSKYTVLFDSVKIDAFIKLITKAAIGCSVVIGLLIVLFSKSLQELFKTETSEMFYVFGFGIPLYFIISVNRGLYQGKHDLYGMSITYQIEMIVRLVVTILLLVFLPKIPTSIAIAIGILISFLFGLFPFQKSIFKVSKVVINDTIDVKSIAVFFGLTAFYEFTQIIINNSDILLVKHYFTNDQAGLYASLALIGRVVYFVAWMFVMMLLPKVIQLHKEGKDTKSVLMKYTGYIILLSAVIVTGSFLFPKLVVTLMFGQKYLSIAPLLWKYALATSIFAIANIFAYYFLSIGKYLPVIISAILGLTQIILIVLFHTTLEQVVEMQIISMVILLIFQLIYFFYQHKK